MELSQILGATGLLGVLVALAVATLFGLVQPVWALVDCIESDRERDAKVLVSIALFFTWSLGGTLYGLFFARSHLLRRFTVATVILVLLTGLGGVGACTVGMFRHAEHTRQETARTRAEVQQAIASFRPPALSVEALDPFPALLVSGSSTSVADFTLGGPIAASARPVGSRIRHVAAGREALYAVTDHDFGAVSPHTGELVAIAVEPGLAADFSWPKGLAFDAAAGEVVVMTSHVYTRFFRFDPRRAAWTLLSAAHRDTPREGLVWLPEDGSLYAVEPPSRGAKLAALHRYNARGASLGPLALDPPIPVPPEPDGPFRVHASSGMLVLMVPPAADGPGGRPSVAARIYAVDPGSGKVYAPETGARADAAG